jgi:ketosteroid isomerase-like protein
MTKSADNITLAKKMYELGFASAWDELATILTDEFEITEPGSLSFGGSYRGKDALREVFGSALGALAPKDVRFKSMTANDDEVVSLIELVFDERGNEYIMPVAEYFQMRGGKIAKMTPYFFDTGQLAIFLDNRHPKST